MTKSEIIGYYKGFELCKSEYQENPHLYLGYSARYKDNYMQVKYTDLEIIKTIPIEVLFLKFILRLDEFIFKNYNLIYGEESKGNYDYDFNLKRNNYEIHNI